SCAICGVRRAMSDSPANNTSFKLSPESWLAILAKRDKRLLRALSSAFDSDGAPEQERSRYVIALHELAEFFRGWHGCDHYADKFMELASALDDLDDGIQPPLLTPNPKGRGRRREPSVKMRARALVALALDALLKGGEDPESAAAHISQTRYKDLDR